MINRPSILLTNPRLTKHSTGVTGYIAGDALYALNQKHPDYEYSALVRTQEKADIVKKAFPNIRIVLGGNDDSDLLKEEAAKADVVLRTSPLTRDLTANLALTTSRRRRCLRPRRCRKGHRRRHSLRPL